MSSRKKTERYQCTTCNIWMQNVPRDIQIHEEGKKHKDNVEAERKNSIADKHRKEKADKETADLLNAINTRAMASHTLDQEAEHHDTTSEIPDSLDKADSDYVDKSETSLKTGKKKLEKRYETRRSETRRSIMASNATASSDASTNLNSNDSYNQAYQNAYNTYNAYNNVYNNVYNVSSNASSNDSMQMSSMYPSPVGSGCYMGADGMYYYYDETTAVYSPVSVEWGSKYIAKHGTLQFTTQFTTQFATQMYSNQIYSPTSQTASQTSQTTTDPSAASTTTVIADTVNTDTANSDTAVDTDATTDTVTDNTTDTTLTETTTDFVDPVPSDASHPDTHPDTEPNADSEANPNNPNNPTSTTDSTNVSTQLTDSTPPTDSIQPASTSTSAHTVDFATQPTASTDTTVDATVNPTVNDSIDPTNTSTLGHAQLYSSELYSTDLYSSELYSTQFFSPQLGFNDISTHPPTTVSENISSMQSTTQTDSSTHADHLNHLDLQHLNHSASAHPDYGHSDYPDYTRTDYTPADRLNYPYDHHQYDNQYDAKTNIPFYDTNNTFADTFSNPFLAQTGSNVYLSEPDSSLPSTSSPSLYASQAITDISNDPIDPIHNSIFPIDNDLNEYRHEYQHPQDQNSLHQNHMNPAFHDLNSYADQYASFNAHSHALNTSPTAPLNTISSHPPLGVNTQFQVPPPTLPAAPHHSTLPPSGRAITTSSGLVLDVAAMVTAVNPSTESKSYVSTSATSTDKSDKGEIDRGDGIGAWEEVEKFYEENHLNENISEEELEQSLYKYGGSTLVAEQKLPILVSTQTLSTINTIKNEYMDSLDSDESDNDFVFKKKKRLF